MPGTEGRVTDTHRGARCLERITFFHHQTHRVSLELLAIRTTQPLRFFLHLSELLQEPLSGSTLLSESVGLSHESQLGLGTEIKTGSAGKWHFDSVPLSMNAVSVSIKHPQFMPENRTLARSENGIEAGREPTGKILLKPGIVITGHVTDETGKPIAAAHA
jgi:hypothetical protein